MVFLRRIRALALVVGALVLACAVGVHAQTVTGSLYGRVVDTTDAVVPGATVTVTNTANNASREVVTNAVGAYTLSFLPPGVYDLSIALDGFKTYTETGVVISAAEERNIRSVLTVGAMTEMITVESETPLLNTTSAEQNVQVSENMIAELPMNKRDITALLSLGPGLDAGGENISINGSSPQGFTFTVDGVDAMPEVEMPMLSQYQNFNYIKGVSVEAVKEVQVSKNIFSAEIGMTISGNVNIISKSGTNVFHGSAFFNKQSGDWNAGDPITGEKEADDYKGFGGSFGGPIVKDKVFFFGVYEGYRQEREEVVNDYVPTAAFKNAVIAAIPASKTYWDLWEDPTQPPDNPGDIEARLQTTHFQSRDDNHFVGRLDFNMSDTSFLNVRYVHARPNFLDPRTALGNARLRAGYNDNVQANYTKILSPTLTSEFRFGWGDSGVARDDLLWTARALTIDVPGVDSTGGEGLTKGGVNYSLGTTWSWQKGSHALRFGGIYRKFTAKRFNEEMPEWEYDTVESLLANDAEFVTWQLALEDFQLRSWDAGVFIQDDFRVNADLMLNIGLRWDYSGVISERDDRIWNREGPLGQRDQGSPTTVYRPSSEAWDKNYDLFSPRFGFAWSMNEKTVIRGGAGIFYIPFNMFSGPVEIVFNGTNPGTGGGVPSPFEVEMSRPQLQALGITYPTYNEDVADKASSALLSGDSSIDNNRTNPRSYQWTLGLSRQLTDTLAWDIAYVGNRGSKLTMDENLNRIDPFTGVNPVFGLSSPRYYSQIDESTYHALQTSLRKRFQDNLGFGLHYTYSSNTSLFVNNMSCCHRGDNSQIEGDYSTVHSYAGTHVRHRIWADLLYELPLGESALAEGWLIGAIVQLRSGSPLPVRDRGGSGWDMSRPDFLADKPADGVIDTEIGEFTWQYLDPNLFSRVERTANNIQVRKGTAPRAAWIGPGRWTLDLSLSKSFRFGDGARVQFRWDLFNATNHAVRDNPRLRMDQTRFGEIDDVDGVRTMQLGLRVDF